MSPDVPVGPARRGAALVPVRLVQAERAVRIHREDGASAARQFTSGGIALRRSSLLGTTDNIHVVSRTVGATAEERDLFFLLSALPAIAQLGRSARVIASRARHSPNGVLSHEKPKRIESRSFPRLPAHRRPMLARFGSRNSRPPFVVSQSNHGRGGSWSLR